MMRQLRRSARQEVDFEAESAVAHAPRPRPSEATSPRAQVLQQLETSSWKQIDASELEGRRARVGLK